jgi:hypothetical protein
MNIVLHLIVLPKGLLRIPSFKCVAASIVCGGYPPKAAATLLEYTVLGNT